MIRSSSRDSQRHAEDHQEGRVLPGSTPIAAYRLLPQIRSMHVTPPSAVSQEMVSIGIP